jgi:flagella basal body P-ring formation protein FlgA
MKPFPSILWFLIVLIFWALLAPGEGSSLPSSRAAKIAQNGNVPNLETINRILEDHFQKIHSEKKIRVEITDIHGYEGVSFPPGNVSFDVMIPERAQRGGITSGIIRCLVNGQEVKRHQVSARVNLYIDVVSTKHFLKKHQVIQMKDVQWVNRIFSLLPQDAIIDLQEVLGKRATLSINAYEVLRVGMVEIPPLVKKGDRVTLQIENVQFKISTTGEAKEDGRKGDRIRLINLSSKKEVYGRILDSNTIQIDF